MAADFNPNVVTGLASGMDTKGIVKSLVAAEQKKIEPIRNRQEQKTLELDAWKQVKVHLESVKETGSVLSKKSMWEGKIVTSSNPEVVEAIATSGAQPGKHTLVVDKLAMSHQVASQSFEEKDTRINEGKIFLSIGEGDLETIVIDKTNNTLQGFVDAINKRDMGLNASIIKTGNKEQPYQVVLTSGQTGLDGRINIQMQLEGENVSPTFDPYYNQPEPWKGAKAEKEEEKAPPKPSGASTAIPQLVGTYTGEEPLDLEFTVVNTGVIGSEESLRIRWEDNQGRHGYLDLGKFNYTPGEPIPVVDGIGLVMREGDVLVNDTFTAHAKPQESELFWWKDSAQRAPRITQPKNWGKQETEGAPIVSGVLDTGEDDIFTLSVVGNGKVGESEGLQITYSSENGLSGTAFVGAGYKPGSKLSLGHGLDLTLNSGILTEGATSTFEFQAGSTENFWWLDDEEQSGGNEVKNITPWESPEVEEDDEIAQQGLQGLVQALKPVGDRLSNVPVEIVGKYDAFESRVYSFTAIDTGAVGVTKALELKWEDDQGNSGIVKVGDGYKAGDPLPFDSGLKVVFGEGDIYEGDSFQFRTFSPVIQPPQDAEVRLGATELGGGLMITNPTNTLEDVIDGVKLNLLNIDEKPVTISIKGDTEKAITSVVDFVTAYNEMLAFFIEVTKYDKEDNKASPLQGDRNLPRIQAETNKIFIDTIRGLEQDVNQLITIGLKLGNEGLIVVDETKLRNATEDDLSKVSNLFRSFGKMDNSGLTYLSSNSKTQISGEEGYKIDIEQAATKGRYDTRTIGQPVVITEANQTIFMSVNGRESEEMKIATGTYDALTLSKELQRLVIDDKYLGKLKIVVQENEGVITISSNMTGARSKASLRPKDPTQAMNHALMGGTSIAGTDVVGSIDGEPMEGGGQILTGVEGTKYEGLKIFSSLTENQLVEGEETTMLFTKGVGTKVTEYIEKMMDSETGALGIYTKNVEEQLQGYEKEVKILEERIDEKRERLKMKFAKMETKLGQLKSEQKYLTTELSKM